MTNYKGAYADIKKNIEILNTIEKRKQRLAIEGFFCEDPSEQSDIRKTLIDYDTSIKYLKRRCLLELQSDILSEKEKEQLKHYKNLFSLAFKIAELNMQRKISGEELSESSKRKLEDYELGMEFTRKYIEFKERN